MKKSKLSVLVNGAWQTTDIFTNKTIIVFAVPGAFTPTCDEQHLPGFIATYETFKQKGIDEVYCLAVNDIFVMQAWAERAGVNDTVKMVADGSALFTTANDFVLDLTDKGLGIRSKRYAMIVKNGEIQHIGYDDEAFAHKVLENL